MARPARAAGGRESRRSNPTRAMWQGGKLRKRKRQFKSLHLDTFDGFPRAALDHLPTKILNSLTCTSSLGDLFKTKGGLFAPSRP
jgi:hypothetical protein